MFWPIFWLAWQAGLTSSSAEPREQLKDEHSQDRSDDGEREQGHDGDKKAQSGCAPGRVGSEVAHAHSRRRPLKSQSGVLLIKRTNPIRSARTIRKVGKNPKGESGVSRLR